MLVWVEGSGVCGQAWAIQVLEDEGSALHGEDVVSELEKLIGVAKALEALGGMDRPEAEGMNESLCMCILSKAMENSPWCAANLAAATISLAATDRTDEDGKRLEKGYYELVQNCPVNFDRTREILTTALTLFEAAMSKRVNKKNGNITPLSRKSTSE